MNTTHSWTMVGVIGFLHVLSTTAFALTPPACMNRDQELPIDNDKVVQLKKTSPLGKSVRAHVAGRVTRIFPDKKNNQGTVHTHFEIQLTDARESNLEVIYSEDFGAMPNPSVGDYVEACGDFINAYAANNGNPPSPSGAIIHWVHQTDTPEKHDAGFVVFDNVLYGYGQDQHPRR